MEEDLDGGSPQATKWTEQVTSRLSVKPVDDLMFAESDEDLQRHAIENLQHLTQLYCCHCLLTKTE